MNDMVIDGGDDPKKKEDPLTSEIRLTYKKKLAHDNNRDAIDVVRTAANNTGVNPGLLFASAYQEGLNKAIVHPDEVSEAYMNAQHSKKLDTDTYPIDGFYNYGLDTFGDNYSRLKKYLPADFDKRFQTYKAINEIEEKKKAKGEPFTYVTTAAFKNNEDALMAKGAMLRDLSDQVDGYATKYGIKVRPEDKDYFTLMGYNGGWGNAKKALDEYKNAKDKTTFVSQGQTTRKGVHKNVFPRLEKIKLANDLLTQYDADLAKQRQPAPQPQTEQPTQ